mmetsp:Transcript_99195/g.289473  ORF Transcript_99195/g.289473 Transcript_99195/m.289473 type:complete len:304 (-) Transcript_99195:66-977(-)
MGCCGSRPWLILSSESELNGIQRTSLLLWLRGGGRPPIPKIDFEGLTRLDLSEHFVYACDVLNSDGEEVEEEVFDRTAFGAFVREVLPRLTGLQELSLGRNELFAREESSKAAVSFTDAMQAGPLSGCRSLNFSGNSLGSAELEGAGAFLRGLPPCLQRLDLSENRLHLFGAPAAAGLWGALCAACPCLASLSLARNNLCRLSPVCGSAEASEGAEESEEVGGWKALGAALTLLPCLTFLDLSENELDDAAAAALSKDVLPRLSQLLALDVSGNGPRSDAGKALGEEARELVCAAAPSCKVEF